MIKVLKSFVNENLSYYYKIFRTQTWFLIWNYTFPHQRNRQI